MNVYEARHAGRTYCNDTEGSEHYKGGVEPLDLLIAKGLIEDFCIGNMIKYSTRFKVTRNLVDLRKVSDYAQILCGVELDKQTEAVEPIVPKVNWISQEEYEQFFEDSPPSKYEGLSDEMLFYKICENFGICGSSSPDGCPLHDAKAHHGFCVRFRNQHPAEFRKIAIEWLEKEGKV